MGESRFSIGKPSDWLSSRLLWCMLLAIVLRAVLFTPVRTPDTLRFVRQAQAIVSGEALGKHRTDLPPGYPVFLAGVLFASEFVGDPRPPLRPTSDPQIHFSDYWILICHILMSLASCLLVFWALREYSRSLALAATLLLAISPLHIAFVGAQLSETFATFLCCLLILLVSRIELRGVTPTRAFLIGLFCVALLLTSPATVFLTFGIWCYAAWHARRQIGTLLMLCTASLLLMIPWQVHCYLKDGRVQPTVYSTNGVPGEGFTLWAGTWAGKQRDIHVFWYDEYFENLPDDLFSSAAERQKLTDLYGKIKRDVNARIQPEIDQEFRKAAVARIKEAPANFYLFLPIQRAVSLWFTVDALPGDSVISRMQDQHPRLTTGLLGAVGCAVYLAISAALVALTAAGLFSRKPLPTIIALAVIGYTLLSAATVLGEFRRNLPFAPAILLILAYLPKFNLPSKRTRERDP